LTSCRKSGIVKIYKRKIPKKESDSMLNDEICKLREKLNNSIIQGEDYEKIYQISVELDELIAKYYGIGNDRNGEENNKPEIGDIYDL